jgi:hypothetical protein
MDGSTVEVQQYVPAEVIASEISRLEEGGRGNQSEVETLKEVAGDLKRYPAAAKAVENHFGKVTALVNEMAASGIAPDEAWRRVLETATPASDTSTTRLQVRHNATRETEVMMCIGLAPGSASIDTKDLPQSPWYVDQAGATGMASAIANLGEEVRADKPLGTRLYFTEATYNLLKGAYLHKDGGKSGQ